MSDDTDLSLGPDGPIVSKALRVMQAIQWSGVRVVPATSQDAVAWQDHDLASMAELAWGERLDPRGLGEGERAAAVARLPPGWGYGWPGGFCQPLWLQRDDRRVGTLAVLRYLPGAHLGLLALYIHPDERGAGMASTALRLARLAASQAGAAGIILETHWNVNRTLRFYLKRGLWLRDWKRNLHLVAGEDWPEYQVVIERDIAGFAVDGRLVLTARNLGDRLDLRRTEAWEDYAAVDPYTRGTHTEPTFALHLASEGWPLIRPGHEALLDAWCGECGGPEALATRIEQYDALARRDGRRIDAPRIPGLAYRELSAWG
jgi:hypothetical protein